MTKLQRSNLAQMDGLADTERLQSLHERFRAGWATRHVIRPLLMAILVTVIMISLLAIIVELTRDGSWYVLTLLLFFIALETIYTTNWLNNPRQMALDRVAYRAAELLLIIVIVRFASWILFGEGVPDSQQLLEYLRLPLTFFFNTRFVVTLILAIITWRLAVHLGGIFSKLEISDFELNYQSLPLVHRKARADDQPIQTGRKYLVDAYMHFWLLGGVLMVIAVGLSTLEQQSAQTLIAPLVAARANLEPRLLAVLLLYFVIGLWLLSQARLMQTNSRWLMNNVETDKNTRRNWQRASLVLLLLVFVAAAFLPIGSTFALGQIVGVILYGLLFLANILIFLITLPFALLLALFSSETPEVLEQLREPLQPPQLEPPPEMDASAFAETVAMVFSSGFWAVLIAAVVLSLIFFLRERKKGVSPRPLDQLWKRLVIWLRQVWQKLRGQARSLQDSVILLLAAEEEPPSATKKRPRWRFLRISGLSPREQIRYFYLSTVRRAGDRGVKRPPADTPSEFSEELKQNWPEAEDGVEELTEAFLKARYSDKTISNDDIPSVKDTWKTVRRELRQSSNQETDEDSQESAP